MTTTKTPHVLSASPLASLRVIWIPSISMHVSLAAYLKAVRLAKANPEATFDRGITTWWPTTGAEIMRQVREGMHDRINQTVPYVDRGRAAPAVRVKVGK